MESKSTSNSQWGNNAIGQVGERTFELTEEVTKLIYY
jgi:hypothetical protein